MASFKSKNEIIAEKYIFRKFQLKRFLTRDFLTHLMNKLNNKTNFWSLYCSKFTTRKSWTVNSFSIVMAFSEIARKYLKKFISKESNEHVFVQK